MPKPIDFKTAFYFGAARQAGIDKPTAGDIQNMDYGVDPDQLKLLQETDRYWIIKTEDDGRTGEWVNVLYKNTFEMDSQSIRSD